MTTTTQRRQPTRAQTAFLLLFHAALSGAFLVAWLTGDEDTYGMHLFAGYAVLTALGVRLGVGLLAPAGSPLRLPHLSLAAVRAWLRRVLGTAGPGGAGRSPLYAWMAVAMLGFAAAVAASGWLADRLGSLEELHEALAELTPAVIAAHVAIAASLQWLGRRGPRPAVPEPCGTLARAPSA